VEPRPEFFLKSFVGARRDLLGLEPDQAALGVPRPARGGARRAGTDGAERRRFALWAGGIGLLFLLISLGAGTPFFKLWWAVMPLVKKTRAPGMAFYVVALVTAVFAGLGADRALKGGAGA